MKNKYLTPKLQIAAISGEDIITNSPTGTLEDNHQDSGEVVDFVDW